MRNDKSKAQNEEPGGRDRRVLIVHPDKNKKTEIPTAESLVRGLRIGLGYDIHIFAADRKLMLGGVQIPYPMGLAGHSDADVLLHAICDAILGAAGLMDIGKHFPDTDLKYKNISSLILLKYVADKIKKAGFSIINIDSTVLAEQPKISRYVTDMIKVIAEILSLNISSVNIKATTAEGLDAIGRKEGIAAYATALLYTKRG